MNKDQKIIFRILQIAVVAVFLGRGWQHIFWDAPFRALLWDEHLMTGMVNDWLSMSWKEYVTSDRMDDRIQNIIKGFGYFYLLLAILTGFIKKIPDYLKWFLLIGSASLMFLAFLYMKSKFNVIGQFLEYSLQFSAPIFLYLIAAKKYSPDRLLPVLKAAIAVTFFCHGLYAVGYYPRPMNFVQMTISTFGCAEEQAHAYLTMVAWLDFFVAALLFIPKSLSKNYRIIQFIALCYCVLWGFMTTSARIIGNFYPEFWQDVLAKWTPEALYRFPHFLIPLAVIFIYRKKGWLGLMNDE